MTPSSGTASWRLPLSRLNSDCGPDWDSGYVSHPGNIIAEPEGSLGYKNGSGSGAGQDRLSYTKKYCEDVMGFGSGDGSGRGGAKGKGVDR